MGNKRYLNILFVIFTFSGFSGLIYESIWTHYLKLFLGHAAYAQTLVLAIFMGGMATGSFISSKFIHRWKNPLKGYAAAELIIGVLALVFHVLFTKFMSLSYSSIIPYLGTPLSVSLYKWLASAMIIFPQSVLLGMTFPLISAGLLRLFPEKKGVTIAMLYFTNSIGGAVGVLASGFLYIPAVGLPWTVAIAGIINIALAVIVLVLAKQDEMKAGGGLELRADQGRPADSFYFVFLAASFITGAASFVYEIGWIRMLSLVLGSSTHAFELMLSAFITGLALGGLWMHFRIDRISNPVRFLMGVQIVMGCMALASLPLYANTFKIMQYVLRTVAKTETGYFIFNLSSHSIAMLVMFPAAFCAGMTLPLITYTLIQEGYGERSIGAVYASNTLGGIVAVFAAVHLGMPLLGLQGLVTSGAALDIGLGIFLLWALCRFDSYLRPVLYTALAAAAIFSTVFFVKLDPYKMASGVFRYSTFMEPHLNKLIYHKDGKTCTVSISRTPQGVVSLRTNGKADGSISMTDNKERSIDETTMTMAGAIPLFIKPDARVVANIGMGTGLTTHTLLSAGSLERVDSVEIEEKVVEGSRNFLPRVSHTYNNPKSAIHIEDAKTFFSIQNRKYDIIVSEPSNPWVSGVAGLFSTEFYRLMNNYLADSGLFVQWLHLYEIDLGLVTAIVKALSENFADYAIYNLNTADMLIIATRADILPPLRAAVFAPEFHKQLKEMEIEGFEDLKIRKVWSKKILDSLLAELPTPPNSDYYPVVDTNAVYARFMDSNADYFIGLLSEPLPAIEMLGIADVSWMDNPVTATDYVYKTHRVRQARAERDYLLAGSFPEKYGKLSPDVRAHAANLERLFRSCGKGMTEQERSSVVGSFSSGIIPFLSREDNAAIWSRLGIDKCLPVLTQNERNWLALFRAVGQRDAKAMARESMTLLKGTDKLAGETGRYILAAGMLGNIAGGNKAGARELWTVYGDKLIGANNQSITIDLLRALSVR